jgi:ABC-type transporter Mla maintaining outer membrane lipid asymmetry ATPase subunit MlaF
MGVLDEVGKEQLIDVLHQEVDLNTFLVSHDFSHPLITKLQVIKEDKISRIEYG